MKLILASASPRRLALLRQAGWEPEVHVSPLAEEAQTPAQARDCLNKLPGTPFTREQLELLNAFRDADLLCAYNALSKACAVAEITGDAQPVLGADTIVVLEDRVLGKPRDAAEAIRMLHSLSGKRHKVKTAVALLYQGKSAVETVTTEVRFRSLTDREIETYVATGEPLDKAGAYGIQGRGTLLTEGICGSYDNVVGLPLTTVYEMLRKLEALPL